MISNYNIQGSTNSVSATDLLKDTCKYNNDINTPWMVDRKIVGSPGTFHFFQAAILVIKNR